MYVYWLYKCNQRSDVLWRADIALLSDAKTGITDGFWSVVGILDGADGFGYG